MIANKEKEAPASDRAPLVELEITETKIARIEAVLKINRALKENAKDAALNLKQISNTVEMMPEICVDDFIFEIESYISGIKSLSRRLETRVNASYSDGDLLEEMKFQYGAKNMWDLVQKVKAADYE